MGAREPAALEDARARRLLDARAREDNADVDVNDGRARTCDAMNAGLAIRMRYRARSANASVCQRDAEGREARCGGGDGSLAAQIMFTTVVLGNTPSLFFLSLSLPLSLPMRLARRVNLRDSIARVAPRPLLSASFGLISTFRDTAQTTLGPFLEAFYERLS